MAAVRAGVGRHGRRSLVEKIVAPCVVKGDVRTGEFVQIQPKYVMTHDNTAAVMKKFATLDAGGAGAQPAASWSTRGSMFSGPKLGAPETYDR